MLRPVSPAITFEIGDETDRLYVLKYGWAIVRGITGEGRRPILRVYLPGEVIGLAEVARTRADHELIMRTDGCVCPFPRSAVADMFEKTPRLAALLMSLNSIEQLELREKLTAMGSMSALDRLMLFLVALRDQLSVANVDFGNRFHLPLTQREVGDVLGLTSIYVNKLFRQLTREGMIEVDGRYIRLLEREKMAERVKYSNWRSQIDTSWYPSAA